MVLIADQKSKTLTKALETYDLRDYMLIPSKPGPRAKVFDLPSITYGSEYRSGGYVVHTTGVAYYFQRKDVEMIARLVHSDLEDHLERRAVAKAERQRKARIKRVRELKVKHHETWAEGSTGGDAKYHQRSKLISSSTFGFD